MKLSELFKKLSYGELSNLALSNEGNGTIRDSDQNKIIQAVNSALVDMYSRNLLLERELLVQSKDWKSMYPLRKEFAVMDPTVGIKYILDTPQDLFTGDVVKILGVTNEIGDPLPLNDSEQWASVFTPQFDTLLLTHVGYDQVFSVTYQALHPQILEVVPDGQSVLDQLIRVPSVMEEMLRIKIAANVYGGMSGQDFTLKAQTLEASYEMKYIDFDQRNLTGDAGQSTNVKLHLRGFI